MSANECEQEPRGGKRGKAENKEKTKSVWTPGMKYSRSLLKTSHEIYSERERERESQTTRIKSKQPIVLPSLSLSRAKQE